MEKESHRHIRIISAATKSALRQIEAGKLKGKTDINPQWRYKAMTEAFGPCRESAGNMKSANYGRNRAQELKKLAFAQVAVYIKDGDAWSDPIEGNRRQSV